MMQPPFNAEITEQTRSQEAQASGREWRLDLTKGMDSLNKRVQHISFQRASHIANISS